MLTYVALCSTPSKRVTLLWCLFLFIFHWNINVFSDGLWKMNHAYIWSYITTISFIISNICHWRSCNVSPWIRTITWSFTLMGQQVKLCVVVSSTFCGFLNTVCSLYITCSTWVAASTKSVRKSKVSANNYFLILQRRPFLYQQILYSSDSLKSRYDWRR